MLRSMSSAISGLRNHQVAMDVIGNNIANVNTVGFKSGRVDFKEAIYQAYSKGSAPLADGTLGGTNPVQVGLGMNLGSIDTMMTQGTVESTGKNTDLMIQGEGFFVLGDGTSASNYTRDGAFALDSAGDLVDPVSGLYVMDSNGTNKITIPSTWKSFSIGSDGLITGIDSTGALAYIDSGGASTNTADPSNRYIGIAKFPNPAGLVKVGGSLYDTSGPDAGAGVIGPPNVGGNGSIVAGALESSNVDLAEQFSRMIMAQRGFQANSRIITTSDEMLQELVNLKR